MHPPAKVGSESTFTPIHIECSNNYIEYKLPLEFSQRMSAMQKADKITGQKNSGLLPRAALKD